MYRAIVVFGSLLCLAAAPPRPRIDYVEVDFQDPGFSDGLLRVSGVDFGNEIPAVSLGGSFLEIVTATDTRVEAALPGDLVSGTYKLVLTSGEPSHMSDIAEVTIGVQGPSGPEGPQGEKGPQGLQGPPGIPCWDGNENGTCDLPEEDKDGNGLCTALDCVGPQGPQGVPGEPGTPGPDVTGAIAGLADRIAALERLLGICSPTAESCDGIDNDCDGIVDEDFNVGALCAAGVGACKSTGHRVCATNGTSTTCDAVLGAPESEVCDDGIDNDCDGVVDEDCPCADIDHDGFFGRDGCGTAVDCNDLNNHVYPNAPELCVDGLDNDCDRLFPRVDASFVADFLEAWQGPERRVESTYSTSCSGGMCICQNPPDGVCTAIVDLAPRPGEPPSVELTVLPSGNQVDAVLRPRIATTFSAQISQLGVTCTVSYDTEASGSPTVSFSGSFDFVTDEVFGTRINIEALSLSGVESGDIEISGGLECQLADAIKPILLGVVDDMFVGMISQSLESGMASVSCSSSVP